VKLILFDGHLLPLHLVSTHLGLRKGTQIYKYIIARMANATKTTFPDSHQ